MTRKNKQACFSHDSDEWCTPRDLFDRLNKLYNFQIDAAATKENALCTKFWTKEDDGLKQDWSKVKGEIWCNPPYSKVGDWVKKADESDALIVMLLPARTDTKWFHDHIYEMYEIEFIRGRLKFSGSKNSAPFPSMLVYF